jgi:uncharacterized PurR-regulated membrane protein YhhQ (DUF165 family)
MLRLPSYLIRFGRLRNDRVFQGIESRLAEAEDSKSKLYPVLCLRFWCHAHIYSPVFGLIFYSIINKGTTRTGFIATALTLLTVSLGSLSFAICDSYGGAYADKHGCRAAIKLGLRLMILMMAIFGVITIFSEQLGVVIYQPFGITVFIVLWSVGQLMIGLPLALIDGADTQLTREITGNLKELEKKDRDCLEGICTKLKYSGVALTSLLGCFLFIISWAWFDLPVAFVGSALFLMTIAGQAFALRQLRSIPNQVPAGQHRFREAISEIITDKVLLTWVLIIAVTEGWLLFATYYFQLDALRKLIDSAKSAGSDAGILILLLFIPLLYWTLSQVAAFGGSFFNVWRERNSKNATDEDQITLRRGTVFDIPRTYLVAAGYILGIMVIAFIVHFIITAMSHPEDKTIGLSGYLLSLVPLTFFAGYQLLRGFASPLLKTRLANMAESRALKNPTTILSLATATGRAFHAVSATLFALFLYLQSAGSDKLPPSTRALTATIVAIVLTILILNVLCGVALDRNRDESQDDTFLRIRWKDISLMFADRAFRSTVIKGAFFVCLAMSNILALKLCDVGFLEFNAGAIPYALTFMLVETVAETEDKLSARKLWLAGICTYLVVGLLVLLAVVLPAAENREFQAIFTEALKTDNHAFNETLKTAGVSYVRAFNELFWRGPLVFITASFCSFAVAQYLDIWLFILIRRATAKKLLWLRSNLSTFIAQTVDTIIFITIAYLMLSSSWPDMQKHILGQLGVKWMFSLLYTPLLYGAVIWVDRGKVSQEKGVPNPL